jgi:hypothetical protein
MTPEYDKPIEKPSIPAPLPEVVNTVVSNPLRCGSYRNKKCLCGSGQKVKVCCGVMVKVPYLLGKFWDAVIKRDQEQAAHYSELWAQQLNESQKVVSSQHQGEGHDNQTDKATDN